MIQLLGNILKKEEINDVKYRCWVSKMASKRLEPYAGKLAYTVLRGANCSNAIRLLGDEVEKAYTLGIVSVLKKPYTQPMLLREMARALGQP